MKNNIVIVFVVVAVLAFIAFRIVWNSCIIPIYRPLVELDVEGFSLYRDIIIGGELWIELAFSLIVATGAAMAVHFRK
jgi:hypothetical protein